MRACAHPVPASLATAGRGLQSTPGRAANLTFDEPFFSEVNRPPEPKTNTLCRSRAVDTTSRRACPCADLAVLRSRLYRTPRLLPIMTIIGPKFPPSDLLALPVQSWCVPRHQMLCQRGCSFGYKASAIIQALRTGCLGNHLRRVITRIRGRRRRSSVCSGQAKPPLLSSIASSWLYVRAFPRHLSTHQRVYCWLNVFAI